MSYLSSFPESLYIPKNIQQYNLKCLIGENTAQKSNLVICGLIRDAEKHISFLVRRIEKLGSMFKSYKVVLYENDSIDQTKNLLKVWSSLNKNVEIISEVLKRERNEQDHSLKRRQDMAYYRNKYLTRVNELESDYVIILDTDIHGFSYNGILNSLGWNLDVCGSNGVVYKSEENGKVRRIYYDSWAYLDKENKSEQEKNLMTFQNGEDPIEVDSCFGGLAIYKSKVLKDVKYEDWSCDHVTLHKQIKDNGYKIWLNPSNTVLYTTHYYESY